MAICCHYVWWSGQESQHRERSLGLCRCSLSSQNFKVSTGLRKDLQADVERDERECLSEAIESAEKGEHVSQVVRQVLSKEEQRVVHVVGHVTHGSYRIHLLTTPPHFCDNWLSNRAKCLIS